MRTLLIAAAATAAIATAAPASAQFYAGAGPGGAGVEIGPFAVGVGPRYGWHDPAYYHRRLPRHPTSRSDPKRRLGHEVATRLRLTT